MLKSYRPLLTLLLCFGLGLFIVTCSRAPQPNPPATSLTNPGTADVLVYGSVGSPVNLEPGNIMDGNSILVQDQIYTRLIRFKPGTTELAPGLATEWSASPDGKLWTFKLRQGVKFHDGTPFNAAAVQFNLERWWDPQHPYGYRDAGKPYEIWAQLFGGFKGDRDSLLQAIRVVDDSTIQLELKQPFAAFPSAIAAGFFGIASPTAIQKAAASYGTPAGGAVGTGAFRFKEWRTGDRVVLEKNLDYWQANVPKVNQLVIRFVTDPAARLAQLRAGQLDFTADLAPDQQKELKADPNLSLLSRPSFNVGYLALNPAYKPLADVNVRRAIAHAINKTAIVNAFWGDLGVADPHFLPPALVWAHSPTLKDYDYNPKLAKQLLTAAGYPNGFELDLWYMPVSRPYFPTPKPIAEAFAADLSAVGIRVHLKTKDWAAYLADRNRAPGFQAFMLGWTGDFGDPDSFLYPHFGPGSTEDIGNWQDPSLVSLLNQARATADQPSRAQLYAQVDQIIHTAAVRLPIVHSQPLLGQRKSIQGWVPSPLGTESFEAIAKGR